MVDKKNWTIGGLITLLVLATAYNFVPEADSTHVCIDDGEVISEAKCDRLSGTGLTCYPNAEDSKGYKRCYTIWKAIDRSDVFDVNVISERRCVPPESIGPSWIPEEGEECPNDCNAIGVNCSR